MKPIRLALALAGCVASGSVMADGRYGRFGVVEVDGRSQFATSRPRRRSETSVGASTAVCVPGHAVSIAAARAASGATSGAAMKRRAVVMRR
jgi:hypothetical protein